MRGDADEAPGVEDEGADEEEGDRESGDAGPEWAQPSNVKC